MRLLFQTLYLLVHIGVLGVFVVGLGARYVHPAIAWWPQPVAIGLPAVATVVLLLAGASALMQRWVLFGLTILALAVFAIRYASALTQDVSEGGEPLTIVTFNSGNVDLEVRAKQGVRPLMTELTPDVLCLQEFGVGHRGDEARAQRSLQPLIDSLGYDIIAPPSPQGHRGPPPVISRLSVKESHAIGLSTRSDTSPAGTVIRAQFTVRGRSFIVYNVHLQSFAMRRPWEQGDTFNPRAWIRFIRRTSTSFIQRASEAEEIRRMMDREDHPTILCGDFNTTPHQWTYRRLADGMRDAFRTQGGLWGPTFPSRFPLFRIDYILTSDDWIVEDVEVGPQLPPDHRPVVARLRLRQAD